MKRKNLLFGISGISLAAALIMVFMISGKADKKYSPRTSVFYNEIKGAVEWLNTIRNNQESGTINLIDVLNARKEIMELTNNKAIGLAWEALGPNNVGGRTRAILVDRNNSQLVYAGAVSGGLWMSTTGGTSWTPVIGLEEMAICCIAQSPVNNNLYVGTGESFANVGYVGGTPGFVGSGLYESSDNGATWHIFNNAKPSSANASNVEWAFVNRIAIDPVNGRIYAATNKGLRYCDQGSTTWVNPVYLSNGTTLNTANCNCVDVGSDRTVVAVVGNKTYVSPGGTGNGEPHTFEDKSPVSSGLSRVEIAIAPSNPNYIYANAAASNGSLKGIYRSTDKGNTWTVIGPGGSVAFNLFGGNNQGGYDNCIAVHPTNPDKIIVGGIVVWEWQLGGNFFQITTGAEEIDAHVDMHAIVFDRNNPNTYYLGSDGGVAKTTNGGQTFLTINKNYFVTQFYAVAHNNLMYAAMGGTQDNSNPYVAGYGPDPKKGTVLFSGDGGWSAFSLLNDEAFFGTMQYALAWRSPDAGGQYETATDGFFSDYMLTFGTPGDDPGFARFVTPLMIWESTNNLYSPDFTWFVADTDYIAGQTIVAKSQNNTYPFLHVLTASETPLSAGDSLKIQDIVSCHFFVALENGVWMTREAIQFNKRPHWIQISNTSDINTFSISKDGNYIFAGTDGGVLYRISNILAVSDSVSGSVNSPYSVIEQKQIGYFSQAITSIAIDPNNPDRLVVTLGNYGNTVYVYYSDNALSATPTFTAKQGITAGKKLPSMPVYSSVFEMNHPNMVIIGTEYGIYATTDITKSSALIEWTEENNGMPKVPVFMLRQQLNNFYGVENYGAIYAGTHGRGFFLCQDYYDGIDNDSYTQEVTASTISVYPNPATTFANISFALSQKSHVTLKMYDLNGKVVKLFNLYNMAQGSHTETIDCADLAKGTYIVQLIAGNTSRSAKIIITK